jgi:hypothetical protein
MGFKNEKLQKNSEILGFTTINRGILVANNKNLPFDRTGNETPHLYIVNYIPSNKLKFSVHIYQK